MEKETAILAKAFKQIEIYSNDDRSLELKVLIKKCLNYL